MYPDHTRRTFLRALAACAAASALPAFTLPASRNLRYGYAAMTWGSHERQAIDDISAVGYSGIQLRTNGLTDFKPAELRSLLAQHKLKFVALSSGDVTLEKPAGPQINAHAAHAQFVNDSGGLYLQILDELKPYPRKVTRDECVKLGGMLTELGRRTAQIGVPLAYHNHVDTISGRNRQSGFPGLGGGRTRPCAPPSADSEAVRHHQPRLPESEFRREDLKAPPNGAILRKDSLNN